MLGFRAVYPGGTEVGCGIVIMALNVGQPPSFQIEIGMVAYCPRFIEFLLRLLILFHHSEAGRLPPPVGDAVVRIPRGQCSENPCRFAEAPLLVGDISGFTVERWLTGVVPPRPLDQLSRLGRASLSAHDRRQAPHGLEWVGAGSEQSLEPRPGLLVTRPAVGRPPAPDGHGRFVFPAIGVLSHASHPP